MCGSMGSGLISGKQRIQLLANRDIVDAAVLEDLRQHAAPRTVHRIHRETEVRFGNEIEVREFADRFRVCRFQVDFFKRDRLAVGHGAGADFFFNHLHDGGSGRPAKLRFELHAIPVPGIVTGCDDHSAGSALAFYGKRNRRRRSGVRRDLYGNARPGNNLSRHPRRLLR